MIPIRRIREKLHEEIHAETDPRALAAGFAVGVFLSVTPFLFLHTVMAVVVAFVFRLSKVGAVAGVWVNNPYTMPFVYYGCFRLGEWLLGLSLPPPKFDIASMSMGELFASWRDYAAPLLLGTTIGGLLAAWTAYFVVYRIVVKVKSSHNAHAKRRNTP